MHLGPNSEFFICFTMELTPSADSSSVGLNDRVGDAADANAARSSPICGIRGNRHYNLSIAAASDSRR